MGDSSPRGSLERLQGEAEVRLKTLRDASRPLIHIGMATCGIAAGALETRKGFEEALAEEGLSAGIHSVGCLGHCYAEPLVLVENPGFPPILYYKVTPGKARMIVKSFLVEGDPLFEHLLGATEENELIPPVKDFPRFSLEERVVTKRCGILDPEEIFEYIAAGGYSSLVKGLELEPEEIVRMVTDAGLRGRGGAGFPTGTKWRLAREAAGAEKTVICNADEGDPGAYMDRTILESNPHQLLEGMAIAARAIGANQGLIYVRAEYPLAVRLLQNAIRQAEEQGLLGANILGSGMDFRVTLFQGSGAFVCGEETALIQSLEGHRGMPQHRPPYPVTKGFRDQPTLINNVKTFASIPPHPGTRPLLVPGHRDRAVPGDRHLLGGGGGGACGACRDPHGRGPADADLRGLRRDPKQEGVQGGPDRGPFRRVSARGVPGHADRLRIAHRRPAP